MIRYNIEIGKYIAKMTKDLTITTDISIPPPPPNRALADGADWVRLEGAVCAISDWREMYMQHISGDVIVPDKVLMFKRRAPMLGPAHRHGRFVLIIPIRTRADVIIDQTFYRIGPSQALMVFPWQFHHFANFEEEDLTWLFMTFELKDEKQIASLRSTPLTLNDQISQNLITLTEIYEARDASVSAVEQEIRLRFGLVLQQLQRQVQRQIKPFSGESGDVRSAAVPHLSLFESVARYLLDNMEEPVSVDDVAECLAMSNSHLRERFRKQYGMSIGHYIRQVKMHHAMRLLSTTDLSVAQIASRTGFQSVYAFSRSFKRETGKSPRQFRDSLISE
ncbi:HTH-type transcriptional activator RhaR [Poriferisphaera corsica]|uniref:HTH-type transcriptional activator RhaR n=2 Tax=Poriferisphaera corsica TaxID=2528020 RepID=A0A517YR05_9BACT|nr:HTH-type transcriptional activator RhaR [Poriferisphaera corsica]